MRGNGPRTFLLGQVRTMLRRPRRPPRLQGEAHLSLASRASRAVSRSRTVATPIATLEHARGGRAHAHTHTGHTHVRARAPLSSLQPSLITCARLHTAPPGPHPADTPIAALRRVARPVEPSPVPSKQGSRGRRLWPTRESSTGCGLGRARSCGVVSSAPSSGRGSGTWRRRRPTSQCRRCRTDPPSARVVTRWLHSQQVVTRW